MTYIKIDSNFVEINMLSKLLNLSESVIEKVIDQGFAGPSCKEIDALGLEGNDLINKIKLGSYLVSLEISENLKLDIYKSYLNENKYQEILFDYFQNGILNKKIQNPNEYLVSFEDYIGALGFNSFGRVFKERFITNF